MAWHGFGVGLAGRGSWAGSGGGGGGQVPSVVPSPSLCPLPSSEQADLRGSGTVHVRRAHLHGRGWHAVAGTRQARATGGGGSGHKITTRGAARQPLHGPLEARWRGNAPAQHYASMRCGRCDEHREWTDGGGSVTTCAVPPNRSGLACSPHRASVGCVCV